MNLSFERSQKRTDEWYTPKYIIDALSSFQQTIIFLNSDNETPD